MILDYDLYGGFSSLYIKLEAIQGKFALADTAASSSGSGININVLTPLMVEIKQQGGVLESGKKQVAKCLNELKILAARIETSTKADKADYKDTCKSALDALTAHEEDINLCLAKIYSVEDGEDDVKTQLKDELANKIKETTAFVDASKLQCSHLKIWLHSTA